MGTEFLSDQFFRVINKSFPQLSKYQKEMLADLIAAFFHNQSFTSREIASYFPQQTNVKHKLKRLNNFLDKFDLDLNFWKSFAATVFMLPFFKFRKRKYISLAIDFTTLKDDFTILAASISFKGRAIPIYQKVWKGVYEPHDYWDRVKTFLEELKAILPEHKYWLLFDRGFSSKKLFDISDEIGWSNCIVRVNDCWKVQLSDGSEFIQLSLFDEGYYTNTTLGKQSKIEPVDITVTSMEDEKNETQKWYLASRIEDRLPEEEMEKATRQAYERRFWIEESFRDLKQHQKWEKYTAKIPKKHRIEKLVAISSLSYALQLCMGMKVRVPKSEESKTSIAKRVQQIMGQFSRVKGIVKTLIALFMCNCHRCYTIFYSFYG